MRKYLSLALISGALILMSFPLRGQDEARDILKAALSYPGLASFWCTDEQGAIQLDYIDGNQQMSSAKPLEIWGQSVPIYNRMSNQEGFQIQLRKLRLNQERNRAKLRFSYQGRVKARLRLKYLGKKWQVHKALIRQSNGCNPNDKGSRFVWDF